MEPIVQWLEGLSLGQYGEGFVRADIDLAVLPDLSEADLERLGVTLGHRKKLLRAIATLAEGGTKAPPAPPATASAAREGERRQLTVMFCDLVGSTELASRLDLEDLREVIGHYHSCVAETVSRFHGFVAKYMGDGVLVYFGYPHAHEDDTEQAVRAGIALIDAIGELQTAEPLQLRIGIATGLVVVGDLIGQGSALEQAIVGETPNLASRLQTLAEPGAIVIADSTRRQIGGLFEVADLGPQSLKGFAELQCAWRVLSERRGLGRFEALRSGSTPLIGRDEELDLLLRRWAQAKTGSGRAVLISGEPGVGKSRLAEALVERIAAEPHVRLRYFCSPHHQDSALYPVIAQMERAAGFSRDDAPAGKLAKLQALLGAAHAENENESAQIPPGHSRASGNPAASGAAPPLDPRFRGGDGELSQTANLMPEDLALIGELHALPSAGIVPPLDVTPQRKKEKTFAALLRQVERLARQQPVLMLFEDIHWIDPSSRELLDRTIEQTSNWSVLLIATFRPEFVPPWTGQPHVTVLALARLDRHDTAAMVEHIASNYALPTDIVQEIAERTDGVPLFVEELTKAVLESGAKGVAALSSAPHPALSVPATLNASLMARLDRLGPAAKDVAQTSAAIGREFGRELLASVADLPEPQLREALDRLTNSGLLFMRGTPPQSTYIFKHALAQDAAYSTLLRGRRQQLHARIAATLEEHFPEIVQAQPALLAQHWAVAGLAEKVVVYCLKAGQQALARLGMVEAETLLKKGLGVLSDLPDNRRRREQELDLQIALAQALHGYGDAAVGAAYSRARQLCDELDQRDKLPSILHGHVTHHFVRGELRQARQLAVELREFAETQNDPVTRVMACRACGFTALYSGRFTEARACLEQGLALHRPSDRPAYAKLAIQDALVALLGFLSVALACCGHLDQARTRSDAALAEARRLAHAHSLAHALAIAWRIGWLARSEPAALLPHADELLALSASRGFALWHAFALAHRGWCLAALGDAAQGIPLLNASLAETEATGTGYHSPPVLLLLGDACRMAGQTEIALGHLAEGARRAERMQVEWLQAETLRLRGEVLTLAGDVAGAEASYRAAVRLARDQDGKLLQLRASTSLARLWRDQGRLREAYDLLSPVYGWFTEGFDTKNLKEAKALLDELRELAPQAAAEDAGAAADTPSTG